MKRLLIACACVLFAVSAFSDDTTPGTRVGILMENIANERARFSFGKPWRHSEESIVAVLPILRASNEWGDGIPIRRERDYLLLSEAEHIALEETGRVETVRVINSGSYPIFIRAGEVLKGKTQERVVVNSRVVAPGDTVNIKTACVHQTKGIRTGVTFTPAGFAGRGIEANLHGTAVNQDAVWASVTATCGSDDLVGAMQSLSGDASELVGKVPKLKAQVGWVLFGLEGLVALECFGLPSSWVVVREALIEKEAIELRRVDEDSIFEYHLKPTGARSRIQTVLGQVFEEKILSDDKHSTVIGLSGGEYLGSATILNGKVIHLALIRKSVEAKKAPEIEYQPFHPWQLIPN